MVSLSEHRHESCSNSIGSLWISGGKHLFKGKFHACNRRAKHSKTSLSLLGCKDLKENFRMKYKHDPKLLPCDSN